MIDREDKTCRGQEDSHGGWHHENEHHRDHGHGGGEHHDGWHREGREEHHRDHGHGGSEHHGGWHREGREEHHRDHGHGGGEHHGGWHREGREEHHGGRGGPGGRRGGRRGGRGDGYAPLCAEEGTHLLMIGSYSCTRHKGEERIALQQAGKLSFLCLQEIDWITGDYLQEIEEAAEEVAKRRQVKKLILFGGCQVELQSLDTQMLTKDLTARLGIPVEFHRGCHLVGYGASLTETEGTAR